MELQDLRGRETNGLCSLLFLSSHFLSLMFFSDARDQSWLPDDWALLAHQEAVAVLVSMRAGRNDAMEKAHAVVCQ